MELLLIILAVYTFFLSRRVSRLEEQIPLQEAPAPAPAEGSEYLRAIGVTPPAAAAMAPIPPAAPLQQSSVPLSFTPIPPPSPTHSSSQSETTDPLLAWIRQDFFVKLGALLLMIAFGWFVSYAFANNWIGPWGRIIAGVAAGIGVFLFAWYRFGKNVHQGGIFAVLGSVIIIMSLWAGREIYGFFTPTLVLALMVIPIILTAFLSVKHMLPSLALASFIMGAFAPLFTAATEPSLLGLSLYLLLFVVGTLWVAFLIDAVFLTSVAIAVVSLWNLPYLSGELADTLHTGLLFAFAFTACFFVSNVVNMLQHHKDGVKTSHIIAGLSTGAYLYVWIVGATSGAIESFLYLAWMTLFILAGFFIYERTRSSVALYLYGAVGLAYLVAFTASLFSGVVLTMILAAELTLLIISTRFIPVDRKARQVLSWLYVPLCLVSLQHVYASSWIDSVLHRDFAALLVVMASLVMSGISLRRGTEVQIHHGASTALLVTAGAYGVVLWWLILSALLTDTLAATLFFMTTATMGVLAYTISIRFENHVLRLCGKILSASYLFLFLLSFEYIESSAWQEGVFHQDALVLLAIISSVWLSAGALMQRFVMLRTNLPVRLVSSAAALYSLTYLWLVLHGLFPDSVATTVSLITYALIGLGLFVAGRITNCVFIKYWGATLLCGVVARLLLVEFWTLSLTMRIITFFVVGVLLISTAFIGRKRE